MKILKSLLIFIFLISLILLISYLDIYRKTMDKEVSDSSFLTIRALEIKSRPHDKKIISRAYDDKVTDKIERGNTLSYLLSSSGFDDNDSTEIISVLSEHVSPKNISVDNEYAVYFKDGMPRIFELQINPFTRIRVKKNTEGFWEHLIMEKPLIKRESVIKGKIVSSLYDAIDKVESNGVLAIELSDIYSFDIDFFTDLRQNDLFIIIVDKTFLDEDFYSYEKIKACGMYANRKVYKAFYLDDDEYRGYYNELGHSLEKDFLKAPLNYRRISSHFSRSRLHPVLKRYMAHNGIDYAAPRGTPVVALGDGKITKCGWNGGLGNYIEIKHNSVYRTGYGHLSGFARNIRKGVYVKKGDLIAYVGSSGLSTGPHLDFRVIKNGHYINPLSLKPNRKLDLKGEVLDRFLENITRFNAEMDSFFTSRLEQYKDE